MTKTKKIKGGVTVEDVYAKFINNQKEQHSDLAIDMISKELYDWVRGILQNMDDT